MRRPATALISIVAIALASTTGARADDDAVLTLTAEVTSIDSPGTPGSLALVAPGAFPVVLGGSGKDLREPVVAAATCGRGRVVAFAHGGYLGAGGHDTRRLMRNAITWAGGPRAADHELRVATKGFKHAAIEKTADGERWRTAPLANMDALREADVLVLSAGNLDEPAIDRVVRWVRSGGGLVVAATGWGWQQLNPDRDLAVDGPMNRLGVDFGIVWTNGTVRDTERDAFTVTGEAPADEAPLVFRQPELFNAARLLDVLVSGAKDGPDPAAWPKADRRQVERTLMQAVRSTDPKRGPLAPSFARLRRRAGASAVPSEDRPVRAEDVVARVAILLDLEELKRAAPDDVRPHPAARHFPGRPRRGARPVTKEVAVDLSVPRWHSTGLYALPGRPIGIAQTGGDNASGVRIRIGCHKDWIGDKERWKRMPGVTNETPLEESRATLANAFGGLVYVVVPKSRGAHPMTGVAQFTIDGAIAAPTFVQGTTTLDEWRRVEQRHAAPWGELICDRVILSLPSEVLRDLENPDELMALWTRVLDACANLAQRPRERTSPERIVVDVQISAGYMHSGYPIMAHLDKKAEFADTARLLEGSWGIYHELGHNHQSPLWTFGGTGEVTCNLFALYVYDTVCGKGLDSDGLHGGIVPAKRAEHVANGYGRDRADFGQWKSSPFLALTMYVQLAEAFGWDSYKTVFAEYRRLPDDERPRTDAEKRDQWLVRFSETVDRNLGPFFDGWGVPVSASARERVAHLPVWEPTTP